MSQSLNTILETVADEFGVTKLDLLSERRMRSIARPRQVAMYLARHLTLLSLPQIGLHVGDRDHTTVMHAVARITALIKTDAELRDRVEMLMDALSTVRLRLAEAEAVAPACERCGSDSCGLDGRVCVESAEKRWRASHAARDAVPA